MTSRAQRVRRTSYSENDPLTFLLGVLDTDGGARLSGPMDEFMDTFYSLPRGDALKAATEPLVSPSSSHSNRKHWPTACLEPYICIRPSSSTSNGLISSVFRSHP